MSDLKLCRDCKHCRPRRFLWWTRYRNARCNALCWPDQTDPVTGTVKVGGSRMLCGVARLLSDRCGEDGFYWEPKQGGAGR